MGGRTSLFTESHSFFLLSPSCSTPRRHSSISCSKNKYNWIGDRRKKCTNVICSTNCSGWTEGGFSCVSEGPAHDSNGMQDAMFCFTSWFSLMGRNSYFVANNLARDGYSTGNRGSTVPVSLGCTECESLCLASPSLRDCTRAGLLEMNTESSRPAQADSSCTYVSSASAKSLKLRVQGPKDTCPGCVLN